VPPTSSVGALRLGLTGKGRVTMSTDRESSHDLGRLVLGFPSIFRESPTAVTIELGQFLENLAGLGRWPHPTVVWEKALAQMVTAAVQDGKYLDKLVKNRGGGTPLSAAALADATDGNWKGALTSFQLRDIGQMLDMRQAANFSVPGAGKTRTALAVYSMLKHEGSVGSLVVVAPKSAHESWTSELAEVFSTVPAHVVLGSGPPEFSEVTILNYERLTSTQTALAEHLTELPTLLVLDEAHRMKRGPGGVYGSICLSLGPLASRRIALSGTPVPNGIADLQSLMEFVWPGKGRSLVARAVEADESASLGAVFTRTTKTELGLPKLSITTQRVTLPPLHRKLYDALLGQFAEPVDETERIDDLGRIIVYLLMAATSPALLAVGSSRLEALQFRVPPLKLPPGSHIRSLLADLPDHEMSPKLLETVRIVRENAALGRKTLVWSTFLRNISTLEGMLGGMNPAVVTGASSPEDRTAALERFKDDPDCMVLISNPATLGEGISLHKHCHEAVYIDRDFAAGRFLQSLDRIHRLGLADDTVTNIRILIADATIDDLVAARLGEKIRLMDTVLDDPSLRQLIDLEEDLENGSVLDASDVEAVWAYLGRS
jgi:superfamily II DNA or RNA helicase